MKKAILLIAILFPLLLHAQTGEYGVYVRQGRMAKGVRESVYFPMHSVIKFPQALYVAHFLEKNGIGIEDRLLVKKEDLMKDTWSPMLAKMDDERWFSYAELLALSLQESDNNACDILFAACGGPASVEEYIRGLGIDGICLCATERQMHEDPALSEENCCTPEAMVNLLEWFREHCMENESLRLVWQLMSSCKTGQSRIPAAFAGDAVVAHKTGTGFRTEDGKCDINDVGIVLLPDGTRLTIAAFVRQSHTESEIAEIISRLLAE